MHVIATAGHVDHGKSALVRALTGMEPDRWAEEIRRGMTIDLGFCWTSLHPAGRALENLQAATGRLVSRLTPPDPAADVRLWVDRSFTITGHGTVVTGTLAAGTIRTGDELLTMPGQRLLRVRGLQALRAQRAEVTAYPRGAVNLRGADPSEVRRGGARVPPRRWLRPQ